MTNKRNGPGSTHKAQTTPRAPYLPPEVHRVIAQYVSALDLPNYRLVDKMFAEIGAEHLFEKIPFHCSSASLARIECIKKAEHLNKYCHTLIWDTNSWNISGIRDLHEWTRYFATKAKHQPTAAGDRYPPDKLNELAHNRQEWESYVSNVYEEKVTMDPHRIQDCLEGFKVMKKLHILNGGLSRTHRGIEKTSDFVRLPEPPVVHYRGQSLYNGGAYVGPPQRPGGSAFKVIRDIKSIDWHLTKLRLDSVCWSVFSSPHGELPSLQHLLSFHLRTTVRYEHHLTSDLQNADYEQTMDTQLRRARRIFGKHHLLDLLIKLRKLRSLKLEFSQHQCPDLEFDGHMYVKKLVTRASTTLSDIISESHTWPNLQKITLRRLGTTSKALLTLMQRQRSTLKVLKLHDICFEVDAGQDTSQLKPPDVLTTMHELLQLERAQLSGGFGFARVSVGPLWDLNDPELGRGAADYLVHGGTCPLNDTNNKDFGFVPS
jgi:hypothetical protein